jgi:hypothetical protein
LPEGMRPTIGAIAERLCVQHHRRRAGRQARGARPHPARAQ